MTAAEAYYRCEVKPFSRSQGHSATAAAAYRTKERIQDQRTGLIHDYRRRSGVEHTELITPPAAGWIQSREQLWNAAEVAETRCNARVAREVIVCFPHQLSKEERIRTAREFGLWLSHEYGVGVDIALHRPGRRGDERNFHAHVMFTTRQVTAEGMGAKTRNLDAKETGSQEIEKIRVAWADMVNHSLERSQLRLTVDHRSYKERGIERLPQIHLGKAVTAMERQGIQTEQGNLNREIVASNDNIKQIKQAIAHLKEELAREEGAQRGCPEPAAVTKTVLQGTWAQDNRQDQTQVTPASPIPAMTAQSDSPACRSSPQHPQARKESDRTVRAVSRQLQGMKAERYEIGIRDQKTGKMMQRTWSREEVEKSLDWLKRMNVRGNDIYIRPQGSQGIVLVDDLGLGSLQRMEADGCKPAVIVQTSSMNYQAWVRVSEQPISQEEATAAAKILAERYGGDLNSADWRHYGRLAGFTNRKGVHTQADGKQPYVLLDSYHGKPAVNAQKLLQEARKRIETTRLPPKRLTPSENAPTRSQGHNLNDPQKAAQVFQVIYQRRRANYGSVQDASREDWQICKVMAKQGFSGDAIKYALAQESQNIEERKKGHLEDYVERTVDKVMALPEVRKEQEERQLISHPKDLEPER
jgi:hypothetical protein